MVFATRAGVLKRGIIRSHTHCYANAMKHMAIVTKVLLACSLLLYAVSVFLPWTQTIRIGGVGVTCWSFKAEICPYPFPHFSPPYQVMFWSWPSHWTLIFMCQILTLFFGLLTLSRKTEGRYGLMFLGLTFIFSAVSIGTCVLHVIAEGYVSELLSGFSIASFAFLLLIASLLISLTNRKVCGQDSKEERVSKRDY
jgi:hypothetical protein